MSSLERQAWEQIRDGALLVDVRTPQEFTQGYLEGALNIPHDQIKSRIDELGSDKERAIVLYCRTGRRADIVKAQLESIGFKNIVNARSYTKMMAAK